MTVLRELTVESLEVFVSVKQQIYSVNAFAVHVFCQQGVPEALFFLLVAIQLKSLQTMQIIHCVMHYL